MRFSAHNDLSSILRKESSPFPQVSVFYPKTAHLNKHFSTFLRVRILFLFCLAVFWCKIFEKPPEKETHRAMRIFDQKNATPFSSFCKKTQVKTVCLLKQYAARCCADHKRILPILGGQQFDEKDYPLILNKINTKKCFLVFKGKAVMPLH